MHVESYRDGCNSPNLCDKMEEDIKDVLKKEYGFKKIACELLDFSGFFEELDAAVEKEKNKELEFDFSNANWG